MPTKKKKKTIYCVIDIDTGNVLADGLITDEIGDALEAINPDDEINLIVQEE